MTKRYSLIQTPEGVALAVAWLTDHATSAPILSQLDFQPFVKGESTEDAYRAIRARNSHLLGQ